MSVIFYDRQYEELLSRVLSYGTDKQDRTGTGTRSMFGTRLEYDLAPEFGFPLITTKKIHTKSVIHELLWMLSGSTNVKYLQDNGVHIWDEWANRQGDLGPVYGRQWRNWSADGRGGGIDQMKQVVETLISDPDSRRMVVSAWNVADLPQMALSPCHALFQFYVSGGNLSCQLYQRSADLFLGVPFNIASYALLTHMVAQQTGLKPGKFIWVGGDTHVYSTHHEQVLEQLSREVKPFPTLHLTPADSLFNYRYEDFGFENYDPHPAIKAPVAV